MNCTNERFPTFIECQDCHSTAWAEWINARHLKDKIVEHSCVYHCSNEQCDSDWELIKICDSQGRTLRESCQRFYFG